MKKLILLILTTWMVQLAMGQPSTSITLNDCYENAISNYPNLKQSELNNAIFELNNKNASKNYYPSLNLNGQASWQSDVTKITIPPQVGFQAPEISKDWYKINLDVQQMIFDGGVTSGQKALNETELNISNQQLQIELYQLKEKVNHLFFNILFLQKNIEVLELMIKSIDASIIDANSALNNGVILSSEVDKLKVEKIQIKQQVIEKKSDLEAVISAINEITKLEITSPENLEIPEVVIDSYSFINNRPEYLMLSKQQDKLMAAKSLTNSKRLPKLAAFGQAGYGRPGYDMLDDNFVDYYMIGARLNWNIWDWNKVKNEKHIFDIQNEIIDSQKASMNQNLRADLYKRINDISKFKNLLETDNEIVVLQNNVVTTTLSQFNNGTVTSTTYLIELNKLAKSKLNQEAHKLQLVFARFQYLTAIGNL